MVDSKNRNEHGYWSKVLGYSAYNGSAITNSLLISYVSYYATDSLLLSAASVGLLLSFSRIFDGFTDVLAGIIIDRTNTRIGRARPFLFFGVLAYICLIAMFSTPDLPNAYKLAWIFITYNLNSSIFGTFYVVCGPTLLKRMLIRSESRVKLLSINGVFVSVLSTSFRIVFPLLISQMGGEKYGWSLMATGFGLVGVALVVIALICCKEYTDSDLARLGHNGERERDREQLRLKEIPTALAGNRYFLIYLLVYAAYSLYLGTSQACGVYYFDSCLNSMELMSAVAIWTIPFLPLTLLYPRIIRKIGSVTFVKYTLILSAVGSICRMFVGNNLAGLTISSFFSSFITSSITFVGPELTIQCMEYGYLKNGSKLESVYNALLNFTQKLGMGIGAAAIGVLLDKFGYNGAFLVQSDSALRAINFLYNIFPAICAAIMFFGLHFCKVEKANQDLMNASCS